MFEWMPFTRGKLEAKGEERVELWRFRRDREEGDACEIGLK